MKNGPSDDLKEDREVTISWLFAAVFGRITATAQSISKQIHQLGTLNHLLGKR